MKKRMEKESWHSSSWSNTLPRRSEGVSLWIMWFFLRQIILLLIFARKMYTAHFISKSTNDKILNLCIKSKLKWSVPNIILCLPSNFWKNIKNVMIKFSKNNEAQAPSCWKTLTGSKSQGGRPRPPGNPLRAPQFNVTAWSVFVLYKWFNGRLLRSKEILVLVIIFSGSVRLRRLGCWKILKKCDFQLGNSRKGFHLTKWFSEWFFWCGKSSLNPQILLACFILLIIHISGVVVAWLSHPRTNIAYYSLPKLSTSSIQGTKLVTVDKLNAI